MIFEQSGVEKVGVVFDKKNCQKIIKEVYKSRNIDKLFLSKNVWMSEKFISYRQNPKPGSNLLDKLETKFIFDNKKLLKHMSHILGKSYRVLDSKIVMSIPDNSIPKWILDLNKNYQVVNLGSFIKPQFRDLTYFRGIDFHQDIIDWPTRGPDFITAYIYLNDVNINNSPLFVVPKSHLLGASFYPHKMKRLKNNKLRYFANNKSLISNYKPLLGKAGSLFYWHPFMLHGTQPGKSLKPRVSIRILLEKKLRIVTSCILDETNSKIKGSKKLKIYKKPITKKENLINTIK